MTRLRRTALGLIPKLALSRTTGWLTRVPLPRGLRRPLFVWFARRYGADLGELDAPLDDFRSFAEFFQRPLRDGARPIADGPLVWPCDGKVVTCGPLAGDRVPQVKGVDYALSELIRDDERAASLRGGSQATVYLAPGDYHRVHSPFAGRVVSMRRVPGTLYPVNPPAVRAIDGLFVKNARVVFDYELPSGDYACVVMVGALNVGDISSSVEVGSAVGPGDEIGRFGFGSTVVCVLPPGMVAFSEHAPESVVRMGGRV